MKTNKTLLIIVSGIILASILGVSVYVVAKKHSAQQTANIVTNATRTGEIKKDETWGGEIFVSGDITVKKGVTLTILPGTTVTVAAFRDDQHEGEDHPRDAAYPKDPDRKETQSTVIMARGTLNAIGTAEKQIVFTSDKQQTTYDWDGLYIAHGTLDHTVVEFARYNRIQESSDVTISNSVVRNSLECCLCIGHSTPVSPRIVKNDIYNCGHEGIDNAGGSATIQGNYFHVENPEIQPEPSWGRIGVVVYQNSSPIVEENRFEKLSRAVYLLENAQNTSKEGGQAIIRNNTIQNNDAAFGITNGYPMKMVVRENNTLVNNAEEEVREAID